MSRQAFVITVAGEMDERLREQFDDLDITVAHSVTTLRFISSDASMLHGILHRLDTAGIELLDVHQTDDTSPCFTCCVRIHDRRFAGS